MILMLIKYLSLEKDHMVKIIHLYTLLNIMIMMLWDHYVENYHKWLVILINLIIKIYNKNKNTITMSLKVKHKQLYNKISEKIESLMSIDFESNPFMVMTTNI